MPRRQDQRQHRPQHQHHVEHRQDQHEVRHAHHRARRPSRRASRPSARAARRGPSRPARPQQAERQARCARRRAARENTSRPTCPRQAGTPARCRAWSTARARCASGPRRTAASSRLREHQRDTRAEAFGEARPHRRRVTIAAECAGAGIVRRQPWRRHGNRGRARGAAAAARRGISRTSRTRGSMAACTTSATSVPTARQAAPGRGGAGDQVDVASAERVHHQPAQPRPGGDDLDDERAAEEGADHHAVEPEHGPERRGPGVAEERVARERHRGRGVARRTARASTSASDRPAAARASPPAAAPAPAPARAGAATGPRTSATQQVALTPRSCRRPATSPSGGEQDQHQRRR